MFEYYSYSIRPCARKKPLEKQQWKIQFNERDSLIARDKIIFDMTLKSINESNCLIYSQLGRKIR